MKWHKMIASFGGIGYIGKGGGTVAAVVCCIIWMILPAGILTNFRQVFFTILVCILGVWSSNKVEAIWGKDDKKVVIDEVAGMMITLLFVPISPLNIGIGLVLFRFFDIAKPLFIRNAEQLPKGWGVMADDVLAGIYAHILLFLSIQFNLL